MDITTLSVEQLRRAATIKEQIEALNSELVGILSGTASSKLASRASTSSFNPQPSTLPSGRRQMSAAGKARIAAAARARWAKYNAAKGKAPAAAATAANAGSGNGATPVTKKRTMSPAARAKIAAAAKARWAKVRAGK